MVVKEDEKGDRKQKEEKRREREEETKKERGGNENLFYRHEKSPQQKLKEQIKSLNQSRRLPWTCRIIHV